MAASLSVPFFGQDGAAAHPTGVASVFLFCFVLL